jgi:hypothetical protein
LRAKRAWGIELRAKGKNKRREFENSNLKKLLGDSI